VEEGGEGRGRGGDKRSEWESQHALVSRHNHLAALCRGTVPPAPGTAPGPAAATHRRPQHALGAPLALGDANPQGWVRHVQAHRALRSPRQQSPS